MAARARRSGQYPPAGARTGRDAAGSRSTDHDIHHGFAGECRRLRHPGLAQSGARLGRPYPSFGASGQVAETRRLEDLDATFIRFANGVRLTVKPTKFRADQILVSVNLTGGDLAFPKDRKILNPGAYVSGGLEAMSFI